jgi:hypothetical protein
VLEHYTGWKAIVYEAHVLAALSIGILARLFEQETCPDDSYLPALGDQLGLKPGSFNQVSDAKLSSLLSATDRTERHLARSADYSRFLLFLMIQNVYRKGSALAKSARCPARESWPPPVSCTVPQPAHPPSLHPDRISNHNLDAQGPYGDSGKTRDSDEPQAKRPRTNADQPTFHLPRPFGATVLWALRF